MRAGQLTRVIRIERPSWAPNDLGTPVESWARVATLRAAVTPAGAEEFFRGQGAVTEAAVIFHTRHLAGVTTADRVVFDGRAFDIREVIDSGRRDGLEIRAVAAAGAA